MTSLCQTHPHLFFNCPGPWDPQIWSYLSGPHQWTGKRIAGPSWDPQAALLPQPFCWRSPHSSSPPRSWFVEHCWLLLAFSDSSTHRVSDERPAPSPAGAAPPPQDSRTGPEPSGLRTREPQEMPPDFFPAPPSQPLPPRSPSEVGRRSGRWGGFAGTAYLLGSKSFTTPKTWALRS